MYTQKHNDRSFFQIFTNKKNRQTFQKILLSISQRFVDRWGRKRSSAADWGCVLGPVKWGEMLRRRASRRYKWAWIIEPDVSLRVLRLVSSTVTGVLMVSMDFLDFPRDASITGVYKCCVCRCGRWWGVSNLWRYFDDVFRFFFLFFD